MKKMSKIISLLLAIVMVCGMFSSTAYAMGLGTASGAGTQAGGETTEDAENVVYVAQIGEDKFETLQAAADVGGSIKLIADVAESVVVTKNATIDLNGKKVVSDGDAFEVKAGATLTINGNGQVRGGNAGVGSWTAIWANGGAAVLKGGTYSVGGDSSTTDVTHQNDLIYSKNGGTVVVYGGFYKNNGTIWTLNEHDSNRGTITVYGGTFEGWDPANNVSEGPATSFVADGYKSAKDGNNYVVSKKVPSKLETDIDGIEFFVGKAQEFTFSTIANDDAGVMVVGSSNFDDPSAIAKLEYYETANGQWYELSGDFGPATGFPMAKATSKFRVTFAKAGEFEFTAVMKKAGTDDVLCSVKAIAKVACDHINGVEKYTAPTCTEYGSHSFWCEACNFEKMEMLDPAGHKFEDGKCTVCGHECDHANGVEKYTAPTCTEYGSHSFWCETCNFEKMEMLDPAGHNWVADKVAPTCTEDGYEFSVCDACGAKNPFQKVIPAEGHNWVANKVAPTCTVDGFEYSACDKCGAKNPFQKVIPADGHKFEDGKCTVCGAADSDADTDDSDDALLDCGHKYVELARKEATCTEDGYIDHDCEKHCGKSFRREILAKTGHNWVAVKVEPTCTEDGYESSVCDKCNEKNPFKKVIPAKGHDFKDGKCTVCGEIESKPEEKPEYKITAGANGEWKDNSKDGLSFTSDAEFADFVSVKVDGEVIDAKHYTVAEGSTIVSLKADFMKTLKAGKHTLTIVSKDGEASTEFTIEHVHVIEKVAAKKATCTEKGTKEHYACACGKLYEDKDGEKEITDKTKLEIKAVGHTAEKKWTRSHKQHWHKCSVCDEIADEKEDHKFDKKTGKICEICAYDVDDPKTGDEFNMGLMIAMVMFSIVGIGAVAGVYVYNKKRK